MRITPGMLAQMYKKSPETYLDNLEVLLGYDVDDDGFGIVRGQHNAHLVPRGDKRLESPALSPKALSMHEIGEAMCGPATLRALSQRPYGIRGGRARLSGVAGEEVGGGALGPSQFAAINAWLGSTDGLLFATMMPRYTYATQVARKIVSWEMDVRAQENKRLRYSIPTTAGDDDLQPGQELPSSDMKPEFVRNARMKKQGIAIPITWEFAHFDQTGDAVRLAEDVVDRLAIRVDERVINCVWGIGSAYNTYKYNDVNTNTYLTSGAYVNQITNALTTEAASLDVAEQKLLAQTDPATGLEIDCSDEDRMILVTPAQRLQALRLAHPQAGSLTLGALNDADRFKTDPLIYINNLQVYWSQRLVRLATTARSDYASPITAAKINGRWIYGAPRKAFTYRSAKNFTTERYTRIEAPQLARRDLLMEIDCTEMGFPTVVEPRYVIYNLGTAG